MLRVRNIPVILVDHELHMVKTIRFSDRKYIGCPLNAAYIYSGFEVDELIVLDIDATANGRCISFDFVESLSRFTSVPLTVGGGISSLTQIEKILSLGAEKVVLCSALKDNFDFLKSSSGSFGASTVVSCINIIKINDSYGVVTSDRKNLISLNARQFALQCQDYGAGEILINSVDRDGTRNGYLTDFISSLSSELTVPLVALAGAGSDADVNDLKLSTCVSGVAAGSLYCYSGQTYQVLLNYPVSEDVH